MVLGGIGHDFNLLGSKPLPQFLVFADDACRNAVMRVAPFRQPRVVIGGDGVGHVDVDSHFRTIFVHILGRIVDNLSEVQALGNDGARMILPMGSIECSIAGQDLLLHVCYKFCIGSFTHAVGFDEAGKAFEGLLFDIVEDLFGVNLGLDLLGCEDLLDHALFVHEVGGAQGADGATSARYLLTPGAQLLK